jgi:hypothetical protein
VSLFPPMRPAPPVEHAESSRYWGAEASTAGANERLLGSYLSPVPRAPDWEQVVPTGWSPWPVSPRLASPVSWGTTISGPECYASADGLTCTTHGGRQVTVQSNEFPAGTKIAPGDPDYHYYNVPVRSAARRREFTSGIINDPTPGSSGSVRPATEQGTQNPAAPWYVRNPIAQGMLSHLVGTPVSADWPVRSYRTTDQNGMPVIVNVTEPSHPLYPGDVIRYETRTPSGSAIQNEGTGLSWLQGPRSYIPQRVNDFVTDYVWRTQSEDIINRRKRHLRHGRPLE